MRWWTTTLLLIVALALPARSSAVSISLAVSAAQVEIGGTLAVSVLASDLGAGMAPSIGGFDLGITYDPTLLSFLGGTFGDALGTLPGQATTLLQDLGSQVRIAETSFLSVAALEAAQPAAFILATLEFQALAEGSGSFGPPTGLVADAKGFALSGIAYGGAEVVVGEGGPVIPEPGAALLFALGAGLIHGTVRARRST